ncbi:hypothetical protein KXV85_005623, partial [Aspergillus fumigatus]
GRDLPPQGSFLDGGGDHVAGQRQVGSFQLEHLLLGAGIKIFHCPSVAAPDVRNECDGELMGDERVFGLRDRAEVAEDASGVRGQQPRRGRVPAHLWKIQASLRKRIVEGDPDGGFRRLKIWTAFDRSLDELVERPRLKGRPPPRRNIGAGSKALTSDLWPTAAGTG